MEACRAAPSILYLPHLQAWWETAHAALRATLWMLLAALAPDLPLLLLTTADVGLRDMDPEALQLFQNSTGKGSCQYEAIQLIDRSRARSLILNRWISAIQHKWVGQSSTCHDTK